LSRVLRRNVSTQSVKHLSTRLLYIRRLLNRKAKLWDLFSCRFHSVKAVKELVKILKENQVVVGVNIYWWHKSVHFWLYLLTYNTMNGYSREHHYLFPLYHHNFTTSSNYITCSDIHSHLTDLQQK
jgi:hypothetical protein